MKEKVSADAAFDRFFYAVLLLSVLAALDSLSNQFQIAVGFDARLVADHNRNFFDWAAVARIVISAKFRAPKKNAALQNSFTESVIAAAVFGSTGI